MTSTDEDSSFRFRYWISGGYNTEAYKRRFLVRLRKPLIAVYFLWRGLRYPYTVLEELRRIRQELWLISRCTEDSFGAREAFIRTKQE